MLFRSSGHLPVSIARNVGQLPVFYYKTPAARRGYVFGDNSALFPFGLGLSYSTFEVAPPALDRDEIRPDETAHLTAKVTNTGQLSGETVVQLYVHHGVSSIVQLVIALRGFKRIHLEPGAATVVTFDVGPEQLSILNVAMKRVVEVGPIKLRVGLSSADTKSADLTIAEQ